MKILVELNRRLNFLCSDDGDIPVMHQDLFQAVETDEEEDMPLNTPNITSMVHVGFNTWYTAMHSRPVRIPVLTIPVIKPLNIQQSYRAHNLHPYVDGSGQTFPLDHIREIIPSANRYLRTCNKNKAFKTFYTDRLYAGIGELPDGLHIFDFAVEPALATNAIMEITSLYEKQVYNRDPKILMINPNTHPTNTILFYSRDGEQPTFLDVIEILHTHAPNLAEYIMVYCKVIMGLLKLDKMELEKSQISLVRYDRTAGLNPHIDSIHQFGDTIGPIATIAIGTGEKMFDMLPTLLNETINPVRIYSQPNQITIMDGMARVAWSHALPWGYDQEQFTVAIKFPALQTPKRHETFLYQDVVTAVPYYL